MADVVCLGILVADVVAKPVDRYPEKGRLVLTERMETHIGGCAANTAVGLAKLGVKVKVVGKVGNDALGDFLRKALSQAGVDVSGIIVDDAVGTSATMVMVHSDGERSFIHYPGANGALRLEEFDIDEIAKAKVLDIAGTFVMPGFDGEPTANLLKAAKERGVTTFLDTVFDATGRWMKLLAPCLPFVDYFIPSYEEARHLTERDDPRDMCKVLLEHGVKVAGVKLGERGCYITDGTESHYIPAFDVVPVDATGAGDAFMAGLLVGVLNGWDLYTAGKFANAVGALCVMAIGATGGYRSFEETIRFMETTPMRETKLFV
ncbi:MAG: carbohydrate kinase family protein [Armatimonadota bacterium]|nr:carbohydrate kinase family protein [Armatimonadota bacterium]MCX7777132.1 carbohydrate kinase family protein [Armatimonadota bacterium]MDW8025179.1 carbohydrate kinase family protein [Armatimonadota bacterium]